MFKKNTFSGIKRSQNQVTFTLFIVVAIFLICQSGRCVANIGDYVIHNRLKECQEELITFSFGTPAWEVAIHIIAKMLLVINSSVNVIIYVIVCKSFRNAIIEKFGSSTTRKSSSETRCHPLGTAENSSIISFCCQTELDPRLLIVTNSRRQSSIYGMSVTSFY